MSSRRRRDPYTLSSLRHPGRHLPHNNAVVMGPGVRAGRPRRVFLLLHRVAPAPAPGTGVVRFHAARDFRQQQSVRRQSLPSPRPCRQQAAPVPVLAAARRGRGPARHKRNFSSSNGSSASFSALCARERGSRWVKWHQSGAASGQRLVRAGCGDMGAQCDQSRAQRDHSRVSRGRPGFDDQQYRGFWPTSDRRTRHVLRHPSRR